MWLAFTIHFNSQPHEEADCLDGYHFQTASYFNSQPHEEADDYFEAFTTFFLISTHSLTKRLTADYNTIKGVEDISTHSLTKRLTIRVLPLLFLLVIFQLTASRRG